MPGDGAAGLPDPVFVQTGASVRVTFLDDPIAARMRAGLPPGSERFVEHLLRTGRVTTSDAIELLGVSRPTAIGYLRRPEEGASSRPSGLLRRTREDSGGGPGEPRSGARASRPISAAVAQPPDHHAEPPAGAPVCSR